MGNPYGVYRISGKSHKNPVSNHTPVSSIGISHNISGGGGVIKGGFPKMIHRGREPQLCVFEELDASVCVAVCVR